MKTAAWRTLTCIWLAKWLAVVLSATVLFAPEAAFSHPLHSEAIERPCQVHRKVDKEAQIKGRCSFFFAAGYLVFQLDVAPDTEGAEAQTVSGAINLAKSTGSLFSEKTQLGDGPVALAESSPEVVHMNPGVLAAWDNGYVLKVSGNSAKADGSQVAVAQKRSPPVSEVFTNYLEQGFLHIIPRGFDHILFVIGLFLLSPRLKALLWQVSAFTVAHTLTLALGVMGVVQLSASIVEPLIALSIVWIAVENLLTDRLNRWRIAVVFCFGLLHGLGFAGVLLQIGLSGTDFVVALLSFNLGVELGQLAVIALCFVFVGWAMGRSSYHRRVVVPASCLIALIATFWLLQRTNFV